MPVAIQVIPDRHNTNFNSEAGRQHIRADSERTVRRPTRGIVLKDDTFATLRVVAGNNENIPLIDAGSRRKVGNKPMEIDGKRATDIYSNFFIQQVQEDRAEKQQILETFGESFIFLFGERARVISFSGILLNTFDFNWEAEWWENYDNYLRGTKCIENDARVFLSFDETLVGGYILGCSTAKNSENRNWTNFQFQMFVTNYTNYSRIGNPSALPPGIPSAGGLIEVVSDAPFRPKLLDSIPSGGASLNGLVATMPSLVDGLQANVQSVLNTWRRVQDITTVSLNQLGDLAGGGVVRVPIGFAGALEFDDGNNTKLVDVTSNGVARYTTFSDNDDEYIGQSDHYGGAVSSLGVRNFQFGAVEGLQQEITRGQQMVDQASKQWQDNGFLLPPGQMQAVSEVLRNAGLGLQAVGSSAEWKSKQSAFQSGLQTARTVRSAAPAAPIIE